MEAKEVKSTKRGISQQERQAHLNNWKISGKSKKEYCLEQGINYYTFMSWLTPKKKNKVVRSKPAPTVKGFSEVTLPIKSAGSPFARISYGKTAVEILHPVSPDFIRQLMNS